MQPSPANDPQAFAEALGQSVGDVTRRAYQLARALSGPTGAALAACWLRGKQPALAVVDAEGRERPEWAARLQKELDSWDDSADRSFAELAKEFQLSNHSLYAARVACEGQRYGALVLALAEPPTEADRARLAWAAAYVGALLRLEDSEPTEGPLARFEMLGDLTRLAAHELNNFLNNITLQLAVMDQKEPAGELRSDTSVIRQAARNAATLVKKLQDFSQHGEPSLQAVDLNAVIRQVASSNRAGLALALELAPSLPAVRASDRVVQRMLDLLLQSTAAAVRPENGTVTFHTEPARDRVLLRISDNGPQVGAEELRHFFQPFTVVRRGSDGLAPALAKALVRRLGGTIHAENQPGGGMSITIELPCQS